MPGKFARNFNVYVDGVGYAGKVQSFTPPALEHVIVDHRGAGMDGSEPIEMGMEPLETTVVFTSDDREIRAMFGRAEGLQPTLIVRGALVEPSGIQTGVSHVMRGRVTRLEQSEMTPGEQFTLTLTMKLSYYRVDHGGLPVTEIDIPNFRRVINGVDQLATLRALI